MSNKTSITCTAISGGNSNDAAPSKIPGNMYMGAQPMAEAMLEI